MKWTTEVAFSSGERELTGSVLQGFEGRQKMGLTIDEEGRGKKTNFRCSISAWKKI